MFIVVVGYIVLSKFTSQMVKKGDNSDTCNEEITVLYFKLCRRKSLVLPLQIEFT
jgi:hypothetical protein